MNEELKALVEGDGWWITNPPGHRQFERNVGPVDGELVDTAFGEAVVIRPPGPADDAEWVCDLCNGTILTLWGWGVFPVPMLTSHALCAECWESMLEYYELGLWPGNGCSCPPCRTALEKFLFETDRKHLDEAMAEWEEMSCR